MTLANRSAGAQPTSVPLLDVKRQHAPLMDEIQAAIERVVASGQFVLGPDVVALEQEVAEYCAVEHAVGCSSGSDALLLAMMALDIGPGDEVILPSYTFFATASAAWRLGAKPIFVDINPVDFNLDPEDVAQKITPETKAIVAVHLFGQCADMAALGQIAEQHNLPIIEDAAQAIGAETNGRRAGSIGRINCFSFYPTKNLGAIGDAGMLTTNDEQLAERLRLLRVHGMKPRYYHQEVGVNSRLDSIQAAVLRVKLAHLDGWIDARRENAERYDELFKQAGLSDVIETPTAHAGQRHVWNQYIIRIGKGRRDELRAALAASNIGAEIYYPVPLHLQQCFFALGCRPGSLPHTEQAAKETLALPIFPELTATEQQTVVGRIAEFFVEQRAAAPAA